MAFRHAQTVGSYPTGNKVFGAQSHSGRDRQSLPFFLATFLDYTSTSDFSSVPYTLAASLDTEPVASSYSGEIRTHSSSTISSSIRACDGYADQFFPSIPR
jgi:hypothetical protein